MKTYRKSLDALMEYFDLGPTVALTILLVCGSILLASIAFFIRSAPPTKITITSGPEGSIFHGMAQKYAKTMEKNGIKVKILTSNGSLDNLRRITDEKEKVDLALIQSGSEDETMDLTHLVSLGGMSYQPLFFFYRGKPIERLHEMKGKKIAIGAKGSGGRNLTLKILKLNGITENENLVTLEGEKVSQSLIDKQIDGAFLMGEDASLNVLRKLLLDPDIQLMNFKNAQAYSRKIDVLHILTLPEGVLNFEQNIPDKNITLMGPLVELIARDDLHPVISDMLLDAAKELHGNPGIFKKRGEFPMAVSNKIKLSDDAARFYKSGKGLLYRYLPFWVGSFFNRILVVFLPMLILFIPIVRSIPAVFRWMGHLRIRRRYRALLRLEERFMFEKDPTKLQGLYEEFDKIEKDVQKMKVKAVFAEQFYFLRSHVDYVRKIMLSKMGA